MPPQKTGRNHQRLICLTTHTYCCLQEGIDAISDVIQHIETYDVTTIRASTPMFLMSRKIKALGVKMVLSGEGSDEVFGGYLYFHKAPNRVSVMPVLYCTCNNWHEQCACLQWEARGGGVWDQAARLYSQALAMYFFGHLSTSPSPAGGVFPGDGAQGSGAVPV
jgi:hypothetical protein